MLTQYICNTTHVTHPKDNGIWVNYYHHVGDPELVNMTERAETLAAPEAKSGALSASTPALEAASQKLCYALSQNYL